MLALDTLVFMSAESRGTATQHSPKSLQRLIADGLEAFQKLPAFSTDDVGHFDGRSGHGCRHRHNTNTLHWPITCAKAKTAATAAPAASFSPTIQALRIRKLDRAVSSPRYYVGGMKYQLVIQFQAAAR